MSNEQSTTDLAIADFEYFKTMGYGHSCLPSSGNIETALDALREKAEREKGCGWCERGLQMVKVDSPEYCPKCGRKLEETP